MQKLTKEQLQELSLEQLKGLEKEATRESAELFYFQKILRNEVLSREFQVKLGEDIEINGKMYHVIDFHHFWPVLAAYRKDGKLSQNSRHAYSWNQWRKGNKKEPF